MYENVEKREELFEFIIDFFRKKTVPPTIRQVAAGTGLSQSGAYHHIGALIDESRLAWEGKRLRVIGATWQLKGESEDETRDSGVR